METVILETKTKSIDHHELFFSVQFLASATKEDFNIKEKEIIFEFNENGQYKYTYGKVATLEEISLLKKKLLSYGYNDVFTIAILNGQKISLSDALSILN